jgi:hypothetical protein
MPNKVINTLNMILHVTYIYKTKKPVLQHKHAQYDIWSCNIKF